MLSFRRGMYRMMSRIGLIFVVSVVSAGAILSESASAAIVTLDGNGFIAKYDDAALGLYGTPTLSGDGKTILRTVDRSKLWSVQTPQTFRVEVIRRALAEVRQRGLVLTDDTAACELIGQPVRLVSSATPNPKVTVPGDLPFIEMLLRTS